MVLKKFGELLNDHSFDDIHHELTMELKTDAHIVSLCKVLYDGLKAVEFVPSNLRYAIISEEVEGTGKIVDKVVAHAEFMDRSISIHDLEPSEIVSIGVDLDEPELEPLFLALCLSILSQEAEEEEEELDSSLNLNLNEEEEITYKDRFELGEKEYDEESLFPFKINIEKDSGNNE